MHRWSGCPGAIGFPLLAGINSGQWLGIRSLNTVNVVEREAHGISPLQRHSFRWQAQPPSRIELQLGQVPITAFLEREVRTGIGDIVEQHAVTNGAMDPADKENLPMEW